MTAPPEWAGEIHRLHRWFQGWFRGDAPNDDDGFAPIADAFHPDFRYGEPGGELHDRATMLAIIRGMHGRDPDSSIRIEAPTLVCWVPSPDGGVAIVSYEEWQRRGIETARLRTLAVLLRDGLGPRGWRWLAVQETWIRPPQAARRQRS